MNHELTKAYNALSANERQHLQQEFANSPKALSLLAFLEELKGKDFTNQQVIPSIYGQEEGSFETLRNRYFKLRKGLLNSINKQRVMHEAPGEGFNFPEEQQEFYRIKQLIRKDGQYSIARPKLETLVKKLWAENIFELLPDAIQTLVYCRNVMGEYNQTAPLFIEWQLAIELQQDIYETRMLSSAALNGHHEGGIQKVLEVMAQMKRIVQKRKAYPRFAIAYHLSHVLNGTATLGNRPGAITRHIKEYNHLRSVHTTMPSINYETNYLWVERFRFLYAQGLYFYIKNNYKAFYESQLEAYQLTSRIPELKSARSEMLFINKIRTETLLGYYHEALHTIKDMQDFQKEHQLTANRWKIILETGRVYVYSMPKIGPENLKNFTDLLERNLTNSLSAMSDFEKGEAFGVVAILRYYNKEYRLALKTYERPETIGFFEQSGMGIFNHVFRVPVLGHMNAQVLLKDLKKSIYNQDNPALRNILIRGAHMLEGYLQGNKTTVQ